MLVAAVRAQSPESSVAFSELFGRYRNKIWRYVHSITSFDQSLIEEIVQDTFLKAWKSIDSLKETDRFFQWVVTIARNETYSHIRVEKRYQAFEEWAEEAGSAQSIDDIDNADEKNFLLNHLSREDAEVVMMKAVLEFSFDEIAGNLNIGKSAAKMKYYRAIEKLSEVKGEI